MKLGFLAPGASDVQRERGAAAATTFLRRSGISAELAKQGADARTNWGDSGLAPLCEPTPEELAAADAWDSALESALMEYYRGEPIRLGVELFLTNE